MKKVIISAFLLIILIIIFLSVIAVGKMNENKAKEDNIQSLPAFSFLLLDETVYSSSDLNPEIPIIISYFHPECEHCQYEARDFASNAHNLENIQLLMVSPAPVTEIELFAEVNGLNEIDNLVLLHDTAYVFEEVFGKSPFPTTLVYSKNKELKAKLKGEVKVEKLIKLATE